MQTPAEKYLVETLVSFLKSEDFIGAPPRLLNAGAGQSLSIERQLTAAGCVFESDRIDVENCEVDYPAVRNSWICSIDAMTPLQSGQYAAVFSNYVLEHVQNMAGAAREVLRVLAPGGLYLATIPNVNALEFVIADHTPLWFHRLVRQQNSWETVYAYEGVAELLAVFSENGFELVEERRWPFVEGYLGKYPLISFLGRAYDNVLKSGNMRKYMGDVCVVLRKPAD